MNFKAFLESLPIMGKGMATILVLMLVVWGMIEIIRRATGSKNAKQ